MTEPLKGLYESFEVVFDELHGTFNVVEDGETVVASFPWEDKAHEYISLLNRGIVR